MSIISFPARYKKKSGKLRVKESALEWTCSNSTSVTVSLADIKSQMVSPVASGQALLKIITEDAPKGVIFDFKSDDKASPSDFSIRDNAKDALNLALTNFKNNTNSSKTSEPTNRSITPTEPKLVPNSVSPFPVRSSSPLPLPSPILSVSGSTNSLPVSKDSRAPSPTVPSTEQLQQRAKLLGESQNIRSLHERLVRSGRISDEYFWKFWNMRGSQGLAKDLAQLEKSSKGIPTAMQTDLTPSEDTGASVKYRITPEIIHQIFVEHPAVYAAYQALVLTNKLEPHAFWTKYFQSRVFHKDNTKNTNRVTGLYSSTNAGGSSKDAEDIFAPFEVKEAQRFSQDVKHRASAVDITLNLDRAEDYLLPHVTEGHGEVRSGGEGIVLANKAAFLAIIRRFHRHAALVVESSPMDPKNSQSSKATSQSNGKAPDKDVGANTEENFRKRCWRMAEDERQHPWRDLEEDEVAKYAPLVIRNERLLYGSESKSSKFSNTQIDDPTESRGLLDGDKVEQVAQLISSWSPCLDRFNKPSKVAKMVMDQL